MDSRFVLLFLSLAFLAQSQDAYYALTNTISDFPTVSVHFSQGTNVVASVPIAYQAYIDYKAIPAGSYNVSIHFENGTEVGVVQQQALEANTRYTMATVGVISAAPEIVVQKDDLTAPSGPNVVRVRVFNGITNAGAVDVQFSQYRAFNATTYKSFTGFVEMGSGTPEVTVYRAATNTQIGVRTKVVLTGGSLVTLFLEGASENVAIINAQVQQVSQYATVRVAHLLKNASSNVDVFLGANKIATDLGFKGISQVATVLYSTELIIRETGKDTIVWNTTLGGVFNDQDQFLIALMGVLSEAGLKLVVVKDDIAPPANGISGRIRFAHAVPELGAVDVKLNGNSIPVNISFGDITTPMEMGVANYSAEFFFAADGKHVFTVPTIINVASGADSIVFIAGSAVGDAEVFQSTTVAYQYAYVRFAHTSFGTPAAQPQVIPQGVDPAVANATTFGALTYGQFSNYTQVLVVPWTVTWVSSGISLTDSFSITLASQTYYTVTLEGLETGVDRLAVGVVSDDLSYPAGPEATAVVFYNQVAQSVAGGKNINIDVYLNGQRYAENLGFSTGSARSNIQPGLYNMTVYMSGTGEMLTAPMNVSLMGGDVIGIWIAGQYINSSMTDNKISVFTDLNARYTYVHLRVSNQMAGAPAGDVAVYIDSDYQSYKLFDNVPFGTISPYTYFITQGIFKIRLANAAGTIASVLYNPSMGDELAIVYGLFNNMTDLTVLKTQGVETPESPAEFVVRFVHTAPFVGPVNLVVNGNNVSLGLTYGSATGWFTLPANVVYRVDVVVNGQLALFAANLTFAAGSVNTAFVTGVPPQVQVEREATYTFWEFRVVHALFNAPAVTVNVDGAPKVPSVSYGTVSSYYWVQSGARLFSVLAGTDLLFEATYTQTAGTFNFLISGNTLAAGHNSFELVSAGIDVPTGDDSRVKLVNVYSTYPAVTIEGNSNSTLADDLEYLESTEYLKMASGYNTFAVIDVNATTRHELTNLTLRLMEGHSYSLFIMGGVNYAQIVQVEDYVPVETNKIRHLNAYHQDVTNNAVAAYVNGQYVQDVAYQTISAYYDVPVGKFNVTPVEYRKQNQIELLGAMSVTGFKEAFTAYIFPVAGVSAVKYVKDDLTLPEDGKIRVRIFNLIDGLDMIDQVKFGDNVVFANVSYGAASHEAVLDEATYSVEISSVSNGTLSKADYDLRSSGAAAFTMAAIGTPSNFKLVTFLDAGVGYTPAGSSSTSSGGLPGWAIALIVIGCIVFIAAVAVAGWMIYKRRRQGYATIPDRDA